jgi:3-carboxy-cis,cis-muconate cycloisomerase
MRRNLDATAGLLFADAAAARLAGPLGREEAHRVVERAAEVVRDTGEHLHAVLDRLTPHPTSEAFELEPAVLAAGLWIDRTVAAANEVRETLARER